MQGLALSRRSSGGLDACVLYPASVRDLLVRLQGGSRQKRITVVAGQRVRWMADLVTKP